MGVIYRQTEAHLMTLGGPLRLGYVLSREARRASAAPHMSERERVALQITYDRGAAPSSERAAQPSYSSAHSGLVTAVYQRQVEAHVDARVIEEGTRRSDLAQVPLLVLVPGLGGDERSSYTRWAAERALALGYATLIIAPRGSGASTPGFYHAGWYHDIISACQHPLVSSHTTRYLMGFSMGGHIAGRLLCDPETRGLFREAYTCCSPVSLKSAQEHLDHHTLKVYRSYLLKGIKEIARGILEADRVSLPLTEHQRAGLAHSLEASSIYEFDHHAITRLLGYQDADEYYASESLTETLAQLHTPMTWALNRHDPFIPTEAQLRIIEREASSELLTQVIFNRGGHIYGGSRADSALSAIPDWLCERIVSRRL